MLQAIREHFAADGFLTQAGVVIEDVGLDWCRCSMRAGPAHTNAAGAVQGGAIFTLADSAFGVASNSRHLAEGDGRLTVAQSSAISYLAAGQPGSTLYAQARRIGGGKRTAVFQIDVTDEAGKLIATMTGNGITISLA
ncbi:MAG: PaaI family thioesterase [Propionibacteriaceae bacterium]|jgi:acyl-CoA thioesterase|nr:PaaI family thioesterase [Propionibacteriaceae bacterium]